MQSQKKGGKHAIRGRNEGSFAIAPSKKKGLKVCKQCFCNPYRFKQPFNVLLTVDLMMFLCEILMYR
jgi:hypothetical protein